MSTNQNYKAHKQYEPNWKETKSTDSPRDDPIVEISGKGFYSNFNYVQGCKDYTLVMNKQEISKKKNS